MKRISLYSLAAILVCLLILVPFLCSRPANSVTIENVGEASNVTIQQSDGETVIDSDIPYVEFDTAKLLRIIDTIKGHGYDVRYDSSFFKYKRR